MYAGTPSSEVLEKYRLVSIQNYKIRNETRFSWVLAGGDKKKLVLGVFGNSPKTTFFFYGELDVTIPNVKGFMREKTPPLELFSSVQLS